MDIHNTHTHARTHTHIHTIINTYIHIDTHIHIHTLCLHFALIINSRKSVASQKNTSMILLLTKTTAINLLVPNI